MFFENIFNIGTFRVRGRSATLSTAKLDESNVLTFCTKYKRMVLVYEWGKNTVKLNNSLFMVTFNQYLIKLQCKKFRWRSLGLQGCWIY